MNMLNLNTLYKLIKSEEQRRDEYVETYSKFPYVFNPQVVEYSNKNIEWMKKEYKERGGKRNVWAGVASRSFHGRSYLRRFATVFGGGFIQEDINDLTEKERTKMNEWFCTVFPNDPDEMPQDFESYLEAKEYGVEMFGEGNYTIESPC